MLSVIVPIYNSEKYLYKCIDSIYKQTYQDLEIILINDGSTDSSGMICDEYAKKAKNIKVFHQENKGLVATRKQGVQLAKGEYIAFVDSDDWIDEWLFEKLMNCVEDKTEMVTSGLRFEWKDKEQVLVDAVNAGIYNRDAIISQVIPRMVYDFKIKEQGIVSSLCGKILKRDLLVECQKCVSDIVTYGEDGVVVYGMLAKAKQMVVTHCCGYHYMQHDESMLHRFSEKSFGPILGLKRSLENQIIENENIEGLKSQLNRYLYAVLNTAIFSLFEFTMNKGIFLFPFYKIPSHSKILIYGAGEVGKAYVTCLEAQSNIELIGWIDKKVRKRGLYDIETPLMVKEYLYDYIVIAIEKEEVAKEIKKELLALGVGENKIIWEKPKYISVERCW